MALCAAPPICPPVDRTLGLPLACRDASLRSATYMSTRRPDIRSSPGLWGCLSAQRHLYVHQETGHYVFPWPVGLPLCAAPPICPPGDRTLCLPLACGVASLRSATYMSTRRPDTMSSPGLWGCVSALHIKHVLSCLTVSTMSYAARDLAVSVRGGQFRHGEASRAKGT